MPAENLLLDDRPALKLVDSQEALHAQMRFSCENVLARFDNVRFFRETHIDKIWLRKKSVQPAPSFMDFAASASVRRRKSSQRIRRESFWNAASPSHADYAASLRRRLSKG